MLNRIILVGRLVRDPELRYTSGGTPVCNFTLAVERNYKNKNGERDVDFIKIVVWKKLAELCAKYLSKGDMAGVDGMLQIRKNESNNRTYINPEVYAEKVQFLNKSQNNNSNNSNNQSHPQGQQQRNNESQQNNYNNTQPQEYDEDFDVPF